MIEAFSWSDRFATGIESVDQQHRYLMELVNKLGDLQITGNSVDDAELQALFKQLADYARFHFTDEERVMVEGGIDPRHIDLHKQHHRNFTDQVVALWRSRADMSHPVDTLHGFLVSWLSFHILGEDQAMARALVHIKQGMSAAEAHDSEPNRGERSTAALLSALQHLYSVLSQQNQDLANANAALETRVETRTFELNQAYATLASEHQELTELLSKVEQVQGQLLQSEKMASVGQLAAGVAHEINNPIGFVSSNLRTLERYAEQLLRLAELGAQTAEGKTLSQEVDLPFLRDDLVSLLAESNDGLERVRKIVANLKDFSHVDEAEWQEADLLAGIESTLNVVWHELKYKTDIVRELNPLPLVRCIPAQINQVVMNLLLNAVQAIPEHGTITLRSGLENDQVWLEIADTGVGMSEDVKRHMFEPFFTTKPVGQGTGLGMSLTYDIINKHGGSIDVTSTIGVGTSLRLWLPIAGPSAG